MQSLDILHPVEYMHNFTDVGTNVGTNCQLGVLLESKIGDDDGFSKKGALKILAGAVGFGEGWIIGDFVLK